jgi:hypothetical protein
MGQTTFNGCLGVSWFGVEILPGVESLPASCLGVEILPASCFGVEILPASCLGAVGSEPLAY